MHQSRHVIAMLVVGTALSGCFAPPLSAPKESMPTVTSIYDGIYQGTVELTNVAPMARRAGCEIPQQATVQISGGSLTYAQPHPGYPDAPVITYTATVTNDSKFNGTSDRAGTIGGQIVSTHLNATLGSLGCAYTLDVMHN